MSASTGYHRIFLALLVGVITVGFLVVMRNFLITVMLAAIFTAMLYPGYRRMLSWCHGRARLASALYIVVVALLVVIPTIALVSVLVKQSIQLSEGAGTLIRDQVVHGDLNEKLSHVPFIEKIMPHRERILTKSTEITAAIARRQPETVERRSDHVLSDHQLTLVRHYNPARIEYSVSDSLPVFLERHESRYQLTNEPHGKCRALGLLHGF